MKNYIEIKNGNVLEIREFIKNKMLLINNWCDFYISVKENYSYSKEENDEGYSYNIKISYDYEKDFVAYRIDIDLKESELLYFDDSNNQFYPVYKNMLNYFHGITIIKNEKYLNINDIFYKNKLTGFYTKSEYNYIDFLKGDDINDLNYQMEYFDIDYKKVEEDIDIYEIKTYNFLSFICFLSIYHKQ